MGRNKTADVRLGDVSVSTQTQYGNPMIYVTENGVSEKMLCTDLCDNWRMKYFKDYINEMLKGERALREGVAGPRVTMFLCSDWSSHQRRGEREGLHRLVSAGQLRVGQGLLGEVWTLLRGLQEQKQAALPEGLCPVLQTPHQL